MRLRKTITVLGAIALVPSSVDAFWRMECRGVAATGRIDPIMNPGEVGSHVHAIFGSNGFSDSATYDDIVNGDCTSCGATQDKSAYWAPVPYFQDAKTGQLEAVPNVGGMLAYYNLYPNPGDNNITAFPKGFRMVAGNNLRRNYTVGDVTQPDPAKSNWAALGQTTQVDLAQRAIGFNCLSTDPAKQESTLMRHVLPEKSFVDANCDAGVRFELQFPQCGDGRADSPNHKDHVAYADLVMAGNCPDGYPVRYPSMLFETIWNFQAFSSRDGNFVISNGDPLGFGYHGDFMMGWEEGVLQQAIDTCTDPSGLMGDCGVFTIQSQPQMRQCTIDLPANIANENVTGPLAVLPGNVAIQSGPQAATMPGGVNIGVPAATSTKPNVQNLGLSKSTSSPPAPTTSQQPAPVATVAESVPTSAIAAPITKAKVDTTLVPTSTSVKAAAVSALSPVSTAQATAGTIVQEIVYEEEVVYVTEETTTTVYVEPTAAPAKQRRRWSQHVNQHRHVHGRRH